MTSISYYALLLVLIICIKFHVFSFNFYYNRKISSKKLLKIKKLQFSSNNDQLNRVNSEDSDDTINSINSEEESNYDLDLLIEDKNDAVVQVREEDLQQYRDLGMYFTLLLRLNCFTHLTYLSLDLILTERAKRFYDPKLVGIEREKCILIAVGTYLLNCLQI